MSTTESVRPPEQEEPIYWFALLEKAIDRGDLSAAAAAQSELSRLGVMVRYQRQQRTPREKARG